MYSNTTTRLIFSLVSNLSPWMASTPVNNSEWILIDTEKTGFKKPSFVVEIGAQCKRGWGPVGPTFYRLLNQNQDIPSEAVRVHGFTREILERDGEPPPKVYSDFAKHTGNLPRSISLIAPSSTMNSKFARARYGS
jgi:DNA polymerase III epsilon subunit-like protein